MISFLPAAVPKDRLQLEIIKAKVRFKDHNRGYAAFHKLECISQDWINGFGWLRTMVFLHWMLQLCSGFSDTGLVFTRFGFSGWDVLIDKIWMLCYWFFRQESFAFHGSGLVFIGSGFDFIGVDDWLLKTGAGFQNIRLCGCFIGSGFVQA
jgi:hypothetical protein